MKQIVLFSAMNLNLSLTQHGIVHIADLQLQHPPFTTHWDCLSLDDSVQEFHAVIGQDRELTHVGDFVKLCSIHCDEVCH